MIRVTCPSCHGIVFLSQFNQPLGRAKCHFCSQPIDLAVAALADPCWRVDLSNPVDGTWIRSSDRSELEIGGSTRGVGVVLATPLLAVFAMLAAVLIWQLRVGQPDAAMAAMAVFAVAAAIALACYCAMLLWGTVTVRIAGQQGQVFSGVGPIGWSRHFDWSQVRGLSEEPGLCRTPFNPRGLSLVLEGSEGSGSPGSRGSRSIRFGAMLNDVRRYFIFAALCKRIDQRNAGMKV